MPRLLLAVLSTLVAISLAACGGSQSSQEGRSEADRGEAVTAAAVEDRTYVSGEANGVELASGSAIELNFEQGRLGFDAGCNSIAAPVAVSDGEIRFKGEAVGTLIGCEPALQRQDEWLTEWFEQGVTGTVATDGTLRLSGAGATVTFTEEDE